MTTRRWSIDIEGSGKSPPEVVELAIVQLEDLELTGLRRHWRFRPRDGISPIASRIHGIWEDDVAYSPEFEDVADDILEWIGNDPIIAHNVKIELDVLRPLLPGWEPAAALDTLKLARTLRPDLPKHGLEFLGLQLQLDSIAATMVDGGAHSAPFDAVVTALLFKLLIAKIPEDTRERALDDVDVLKPRQASLL